MSRICDSNLSNCSISKYTWPKNSNSNFLWKIFSPSLNVTFWSDGCSGRQNLRRKEKGWMEWKEECDGIPVGKQKNEIMMHRRLLMPYWNICAVSSTSLSALTRRATHFVFSSSRICVQGGWSGDTLDSRFFLDRLDRRKEGKRAKPNSVLCMDSKVWRFYTVCRNQQKKKINRNRNIKEDAIMKQTPKRIAWLRSADLVNSGPKKDRRTVWTLAKYHPIILLAM